MDLIASLVPITSLLWFEHETSDDAGFAVSLHLDANDSQWIGTLIADLGRARQN